MISSLSKIFRKALRLKPRHPLHEVTCTPEDMLRSLGYNPEILRRHKIDTQGIRILDLTPVLTRKQKENLFKACSVLPNSRTVTAEIKSRLENTCLDPGARMELYLILFNGRDMSYPTLVSEMTGLPKGDLEITDSIAKKSGFLAFAAIHELAHFEMPSYHHQDISEGFRVETHCDRRALKILGQEPDFMQNSMGREIMLMRAIRHTYYSVKMALQSNKYHMDGEIKAHNNKSYSEEIDISHATALPLKNKTRTFSFEKTVKEYKGLMPLFAMVLRHHLGRPLFIDYAHIYKAARIMQASADVEAKGSALSPVQREILELYVEGMEHFCPSKCASWRTELGNGMIPASAQVYNPGLEASP